MSSTSGPGAYVLDLTWISDQTGWALSTSRCGSKSCLQVAHTTDGGKSWRQLQTLADDLRGDCSQAGCVSHIRFADASIGYLFGPGLFVTRDGGAHWVRQRGLSVEALEPGDGEVFRVAYAHTGCPGPCGRIIQEARPGSPLWRTVLSVGNPPADSQETDAQIIRAGRAVYVPLFGNLAAGAGTQHTIVFRSLDGGAHWRRVEDPCGGSGQDVHDAVSLAAAPGGFLSALCVPRVRLAAPTFVVTSSNDGTSWSAARPLPNATANYGLIAAADLAHLVVATTPATGSTLYTYRLLSTRDGGRHWRVVVSDPEHTDPRAPDAVWTTRDAGAHWTRDRY